MKKFFTRLMTLVSLAGFAYSGWIIYGAASKGIQTYSLSSNIKKLNKEKSTKDNTFAELTKKSDEMNQKYEQLKKDGKIKVVYLTFDDGPSIYTDQILEILRKNNIKATFFVLGHEQEQYKKIVDEGHTIALHSLYT